MAYNVLLPLIDLRIPRPMLFHWASARSLYVGSNKTSVLNTAKMIVVESIVWVNRVRKIVNCKHGPGKKTVISFFVAGVSLKKTWILFFLNIEPNTSDFRAFHSTKNAEFLQAIEKKQMVYE